MNVFNIFKSWAAKMEGQYVRAQKVNGCSLEIETPINAEDGLRVFLCVHFVEPPGADIQDERILQKLLSEIPREAYTRSLSPKGAIDTMLGQAETQWFLADELPALKG